MYPLWECQIWGVETCMARAESILQRKSTKYSTLEQGSTEATAGISCILSLKYDASRACESRPSQRG